jgi:hypothetical protein
LLENLDDRAEYLGDSECWEVGLRAIVLPRVLDFQTYDEMFAEVASDSTEAVVLDGMNLKWIDPNGMVNLLAVGSVVRDKTGHTPRLILPKGEEVTSYMERMGFFRAAKEIFSTGDLVKQKEEGETSDVLLEVTQITQNSDIHKVVDKVQNRAGAILTNTLDYAPNAVVQFSVVLSEVCQNIIEHAESAGWVAAQTYNWSHRLGRLVVVISVTDLGVGFRGSLSSEHSNRFGKNWDDTRALEAVFVHGLTRFPDMGRGQGIQQIRKQVRKWNGMISVRSGTSRIIDAPHWFESASLQEGLPSFPGTQINIVVPKRIQHEL